MMQNFIYILLRFYVGKSQKDLADAGEGTMLICFVIMILLFFMDKATDKSEKINLIGDRE